MRGSCCASPPNVGFIGCSAEYITVGQTKGFLLPEREYENHQGCRPTRKTGCSIKVYQQSSKTASGAIIKAHVYSPLTQSVSDLRSAMPF